jgi:FkbM family methyltransferase
MLNNLTIPENINHIKIDIGLGNCNVNSRNWLQNEKDLLVIMFDPNIDSINSSCNRMKNDNIGFNNNNIYHIIPVGLSDVESPTTTKFYNMNNDSGTSSLHKPIDNRLGPVKETITIDVISLKYFFDIFPWNRFEYIEYIKVDAQGSDFDIIKSAGNYLMDRVVYITAEPEIDFYENCSHNTAENMEQYLLTQNFIKVNHPNTRDPTFLNKKFIHLKDSIYIYQQ